MVNRAAVRFFVFLLLAVGASNWLVVSRANAATDDRAFNNCLQVLDSDPDVLKRVSWHTSPLDPKLQKLEAPRLWGDYIVRWMAHKNPNGSRTIIIMTRAPDDFLADDPDDFDFYMQKGSSFIYLDGVLSNAIAFSKHSNDGVLGLWVCKWDIIYKEWTWFGKDWEILDNDR